jgi:putative FmdB family regulatory protein
MPIYEYRCQECESHFEKMQKVSDAPLEICEKCSGKLQKQWSLSGFQFKGAGWYVTDYSNKGKTEAKTDAKAETKSEASTGGAEKSSPAESTAESKGASNTTKSDSSTAKKE